MELPSFVEDTQLATDRRQGWEHIAAPAPNKTDEHDPIATARGVATGLVISIALCASIGFAAWYLL
jgi:hypothetical protein